MSTARLLILALLLCCSLAARAFTGSEACRDCHAEQHALWQGSHHDLAMQLPTPETVLGDFNDSVFDYHGVETRFFRRGERFMVRTDGEDGKPAEFEVAYVFGVDPLQQYLLPLSRGRLQALSIAWDTRPAEQGGQRWFHLYPDEHIDYKDPLHWTGPYQSWNTMCAECHSVDVQKRYDAAAQSFDTTFAEIDVGCEACHGPGEQHLELAAAGKLADAPHGGFPTALAQRGQWTLAEGANIAHRQQPLTSNAQIDACGRCHARRGTLGDYHYGADLSDTHRLALPLSPLYYPDGQILDEVYEYGSFAQSKMHQAGVVCSNCHEPHSLELRAPGNGVCAQCHVPTHFDTVEHHGHAADSTGALCANCHMPETTYMVVDPRRDHSMRIPRPDLSLVLGTPNACNQCHEDRDAAWALDALRKRGVSFRDTATHPARAFHQLQQGDVRAAPRIAQIAIDPAAAPIWRASAIEVLGSVGGRDALQAITATLFDDNALLRAASVRALDILPPEQRVQLLAPLLDDPVATVRMDVAAQLAAVPRDQLPPEQRDALRKLDDEYVRILGLHADMPASQMQLGLYYAERGDAAAAEAAYREALRLNPQLLPAYLNLADLMREQAREDDARTLLLQGLKVAPEHGPTLHTLGLLEARTGHTDQALTYLRRAAELETTGVRHRYVYAIALHDFGQPQVAVSELQAVLRTAPQNEEVLLALVNYLAELGRQREAAGYAQTLTRIAPGNRAYADLYRQLSSSAAGSPATGPTISE